jgi:L-2,4-diaminobutyric acid acetyltransferase
MSPTTTFEPEPDRGDGIRLRLAQKGDGAAIWSLVKRTGILDLNSSYAYVMVCDFFGATCVVAEEGDAVVGFVTGFVEPDAPARVFLWQVGVAPEVQRCGLGRRLVDAFVRTPGAQHTRFLETTIAPSNEPSKALFHAFARRHRAAVERFEQYPAALFPNGHEAEELYRIGPLARS